MWLSGEKKLDNVVVKTYCYIVWGFLGDGEFVMDGCTLMLIAIVAGILLAFVMPIGK